MRDMLNAALAQCQAQQGLTGSYAQYDPSPSYEGPKINTECVKCGATNTFARVTYRRGWFRGEWLEADCQRCGRKLRFETLDARARALASPGPSAS